MALLWMDGFDQYGEDESLMLDNLYTENATGATLTANGPRTGSRSLEMPSNGSSNSLRRTVNTAETTLGVGGAWHFGTGSLGADRDLIYVYSDTNAYFSVAINTTWGIEVKRAATVLGTSANDVITSGIYNHIEVKFDLATSATGSVEVKVNGVTVLSLANVQTYTTGTSFASVSWRVVSASTPSGYLDDIFIWDTAGTLNNDFLGQKHVITLIPDSDTATADWTGTYADIDDIPPDDDTSYILAADTSLPRTSDFGLSDVPTDYTNVSGVMTTARLRKDSVGTAEARVSMVSSGSASDGALNSAGDNYVYFTDMHETDPNTSAAWTISGINAAQLRVKRET